MVPECVVLDGQLNQLDACLDSLEVRSDDLVSKLKAILQASQTEPESPDTRHTEDGGDDGNGRTGKSDGDISAVGRTESCNS